MKLSQATITGALTGGCLAFAICMVKDINLTDALFRIFILAIGGAWVGFLLAWLNYILPHSHHHSEHNL